MLVVEFFDFVKTLSPTAIDFELNSLSLDPPYEQLLWFLKALKCQCERKKDFELVQAYLQVFLKASLIFFFEKKTFFFEKTISLLK